MVIESKLDETLAWWSLVKDHFSKTQTLERTGNWSGRLLILKIISQQRC